MNLDKAMDLAKNTDYYYDATHQDINPINVADAGAFFLEGYEYFKKGEEWRSFNVAYYAVSTRLEKQLDILFELQDKFKDFDDAMLHSEEAGKKVFRKMRDKLSRELEDFNGYKRKK